MSELALYKGNFVQITETKENLEKELTERRKENEILFRENRKLQIELENLMKMFAGNKESHSKGELRQQVLNLNKDLAAAQAEIESLKSEKEKLQNRIKEMELNPEGIGQR